MEGQNELTAKEALMNQMANAYEQAQNLLENPDLSDEDIKKARELNKIFLDCYDRFAKDEMHIDELNIKYQELEAVAARYEKDKEVESERFNAEKQIEAEAVEREEKHQKIDTRIKIGSIIVTGLISIGIAIVSGKHADRIALAESVSMIGTKDAFRAAEKAFGDNLKNVGKIVG